MFVLVRFPGLILHVEVKPPPRLENELTARDEVGGVREKFKSKFCQPEFCE